jgi:membrane associated rhomboid family serine protease
MLPCPHCHHALHTTKTLAGNVWDCPAGHGRFAMLRVLKGLVHDVPLSQAWKDAHWSDARPGYRCPSCHQAMSAVRVQYAAIEMEVCRHCQCIWLDREQQLRLPPRITPLPPTNTHKTQQAAAIKRQITESHRRFQQGDAIGDGPDQTWKKVLGILGVPVEIGAMETLRRPWVTWSFLVIVALTSIWAMTNGLGNVVQQWGFIANDPWRMNGLTWVSTLFIHGGIAHLLGNLYFWWLAGDNVEDILGRRRYLVVIFAGMLVGNLFHLLGDPRPEIPCVGASHAISAILAIYALSFPRAQIGLPFWFGTIWLRVPAWLAFLLWMGVQSVLVWQQINGFGNVSALAHLGGVTVGVLLWWWWIGSREKIEKTA